MSRSILAEEIKKRFPFDSPAEEAFLNLARTHAQLTGPLDGLFKRHGVSPAKYNILRILRGAARVGDGCKAGLPSLEVAQRMITRLPDITRLVDGLEAAGLVLRRLDKPVLEMVEALLKHMSKQDLADLGRLLVKARKSE